LASASDYLSTYECKYRHIIYNVQVFASSSHNIFKIFTFNFVHPPQFTCSLIYWTKWKCKKCEIKNLCIVRMCKRCLPISNMWIFLRHIVYNKSRQPFPSCGPKSKSARYGGPYLFSTNNSVSFAAYDVEKTWEFMDFTTY